MSVQAHQPPSQHLGFEFIASLFDQAGRSCRGAALAFLSCIVEWRARARSRAELAMAMDGTVRDLGCSRADAGAEIRKPFWQLSRNWYL
jgi:uncharacterized protein YjiS (DUF1127 family)